MKPSQDGLRRAMIARRTRCARCNGKGRYTASYPTRPIDPCPVCNGTGRGPGR